MIHARNRAGRTRVVTADEIAGVAIFADLGRVERERLRVSPPTSGSCRASTRSTRVTERALFAVLEGRLETVALVDGIARVVGGRGVGDLFGEVPIALGTTFPFGFRAAEPSRVIRIEAARVSRDRGRRRRRSASSSAPWRGSGSAGCRASPPSRRRHARSSLGHRWDASCAELRRFLDRNQVTFRWITPDAPDAAEQWGGPLPAEEDCPVDSCRRREDGRAPQLRRVAELLALATEAAAAEYDTVIIGGGPAGLAAAVYGASEGLKTIVIEREAPGGQAGASARIENYLGFPSGVSGDELATPCAAAGAAARRGDRGDPVDHAHRYLEAAGAPRQRRRPAGPDDRARLRRVVAAPVDRGLRPARREGHLVRRGAQRGVEHSRARRPYRRRGQLGGAGGAVLLEPRAQRDDPLPRRRRSRRACRATSIDQMATRASIKVRFGAEVTAVHGEASLEAIDVHDAATGETTALESGGLFVFIGADADTAWLPPEIAVDHNGYVLTGPDVRAAARWELDRDPYLLETSVPGIFACGDVRFSPVKRVAAAVGEGSMAIAFVHQYLKEADPTLAGDLVQVGAAAAEGRVDHEPRAAASRLQSGSTRSAALEPRTGARRQCRDPRRSRAPQPPRSPATRPRRSRAAARAHRRPPRPLRERAPE